ncbi:uncharacterized protein [Eurosta solidaginis]|uniref:uncharacterized protein n=1 Tax=Eurosta solidaginis TaxID=178769 RepID=UPI0035306E0F
MRSIWFTFKFVEGCLGCLCMGIQIEGFLNVEVSQDLYLYITVFSIFTCVSFFGCIDICMNNDPTMLREAIWNGIVCLGYIITAITTLYHAEKDLYLIYLSGLDIIEDEAVHPFFRYSKAQAIIAIVTGVVHMLHSVLTTDVLFSDLAAIKAEEEGREHTRFRLYLGGIWIHTRLLRLKWFRRFEGIVPAGNQ